MVHFLVEDTGPSWITPLSNLTSKLTKPTACLSHVAVKQAELQRVSAFVEVYEHNQICVDVSTRVYTTTTALIHIYICIYHTYIRL